MKSRVALCAVLLLVGCDLERMIDQERFSPYEACEFFPDGKVMRDPPQGTVPHDAITGDPELTEGLVRGTYAQRVPVSITPELLRAGRTRFEIHCAACHGVLGDGDSQVARSMTLRRPPSLIAPPVTDYPPGRIQQVILEGYGLMRSYQHELQAPDERWSVVAYVMALQRSRAVPLEALPPALRRRALEALGGEP